MLTRRAIPTKYKGYHFRSRLEARWAVFLDSHEVPYQYELQGFALPSGQYLPDFWLPGLNVWYEVKGPKPTRHEEVAARELSQETGMPCVIAWGDVGASAYGGYGGLDLLGAPLWWLRDDDGRINLLEGDRLTPDDFRPARSARFEFGETPIAKIVQPQETGLTYERHGIHVRKYINRLTARRTVSDPACTAIASLIVSGEFPAATNSLSSYTRRASIQNSHLEHLRQKIL